MMKISLDWNCVIEVEEDRPQARFVLELIDRHRAGEVEVALLAASASENTKSKRFPGNANLFHERVNAIGWSDLPIVPMPMIISLSYWGNSYPVENASDFERQKAALWSVMAPGLAIDARDHLPQGVSLTDVSIQSKDLFKWRNAWCDVISAYSHIKARRDLFVTNNKRDFQENAAKLYELGMKRIASPKGAAELLRSQK